MPNEPRSEVSIRFSIDFDANGNVVVTSSQPRVDGVTPTEYPPRILFTGFKAAHRKELEAMASTKKLEVCKSICHGVILLVTGANAGPAKIKDAQERGISIINEPQFLTLIATGELPSPPTVASDTPPAPDTTGPA